MHGVGNIVEAVLWGVIALIMARGARFATGKDRRACIFAAMSLALFGLSDVVEVYTGAWWRPWWLLAWKGLCIGVFVWLLYDHYRRKQKADGPVGPDSSD